MVHEPAPLVNVSLQLTDQLLDLVGRFPRNLQHSLGRKITDGAMDLLIHVSAATSRIDMADKERRLLTARERYVALTVLLRLAYRRKLLSEGAYAQVCITLVDVEGQMDAFVNWVQGMGR